MASPKSKATPATKKGADAIKVMSKADKSKLAAVIKEVGNLHAKHLETESALTKSVNASKGFLSKEGFIRDEDSTESVVAKLAAISLPKIAVWEDEPAKRVVTESDEAPVKVRRGRKADPEADVKAVDSVLIS